MEIVKIIGVGLVALIIIVILKQYRHEFAMYVSLSAGVIIFALIFTKFVIKSFYKQSIYCTIDKDYRYCNTY